MRLSRIEVDKLFGLYDHTIELRLEGRITIIYGPNGVGKTVILKLLNSLIKGDYRPFTTTPFDRFEVTFDDGRSVTIRPTPPDENSKGPRSVSCTVSSPESPDEEFTLSGISSKNVPKRLLVELDEHIPAPYRLKGREWSTPDGETHSLAEVLDQFSMWDLAANLGIALSSDVLSELMSGMKVHLVETHRLRTSVRPDSVRYRPPYHPYQERPTVRLTVDEYSQDIAKRISRVLETYAAKSQELDRTFPARLLGQADLKAASQRLEPDEILKRFETLETKRAQLIELGFLDKEEELALPNSEQIGKWQDVLSVYVDDVDQKLSVFSDMANRIDTFVGIVNKRFTHKQVSVNRDDGLIFTTQKGPLNPSLLSSGEQHELVLFYELLFLTEENVLLLVDEPEISLHLEWQKEFMGDLQRIVDLSSIDVLLATHSPAIIGTHWDLTAPLSADVSAEQ